MLPCGWVTEIPRGATSPGVFVNEARAYPDILSLCPDHILFTGRGDPDLLSCD